MPRRGRDDLDALTVLDVGCGTKVVKSLLDDGAPIGRYVGIDVEPDVIDWLTTNVDDPRFEFHHLPARNDMYNPTGLPLAQFERLPAPLDAFDLIGLFSVFTHLAPDDFVAMLRLLRLHVKADGRLVFSLFLNDPDHPSPWAHHLDTALASDDPEVAERTRAAIGAAIAAKDRGFIDEDPSQPLLRARYDIPFAQELVEGTGWEILSIEPPEPHIQHRMVCRPA